MATTKETVIVTKTEVGPKPYMESSWWFFLPFYIFVVLAIIALIVMIFAGTTAGAFLGTLIFLILWGLLLWWLCDIGQLGWAWFFLLLPFIITLLIAIISAGVTGGVLAAEAANVAFIRGRVAARNGQE